MSIADVATHDEAACMVRQLTVAYRTPRGEFPALKDVNLDIPKGRITAIIGESGSGKSTLALAMMGAVSSPGRIVQGSIVYTGLGDILSFDRRRLRQVRGKVVSMVFQASQNSLNPLKRIGAQLMDLGRDHGIADPKRLIRDVSDLARRMSLDPERVLMSYQHQLSGGMRQRVGILLALALSPEVLLLDEPTTALDVLSQSEVLEIVRQVQRERHLTTLLVTHDLGVVADLADRVIVLYAGRVAEVADTADLLRYPRHPYTRALIQAIPRLTGNPGGARPLPGQPPELTSIPLRGCVFRDRCDVKMSICDHDDPPMVMETGTHEYVCHLGSAQ